MVNDVQCLAGAVDCEVHIHSTPYSLLRRGPPVLAPKAHRLTFTQLTCIVISSKNSR
jgi:hypothetical protein